MQAREWKVLQRVTHNDRQGSECVHCKGLSHSEGGLDMSVHSDIPRQETIFSKTLRVESKTIFVDIKENESGQYLKIAERSTKGDRQTVVMALSGIMDLRDALDEALEKISTIKVLSFSSMFCMSINAA